MAKNRINIVISATTKGVRGALGKVSSAIGTIKNTIFSLKGLVVGGGLALLGKSLLDTASTFEDLELSLSTTLGTMKKAREAIKYANEEAAASPFTVLEYAEAIRTLSAYGIEYTAVMTTLGDTAAAMGKPLQMAVEAMSDAMQGEGERLKTFGIKQKIAGDQITYTWVDTMGKVRETVAKNSPDIIQKTLLAIWNEKYEGGMAKFLNAWSGLTSTLKSLWDEFKLAVMESGAFEYLKEALKLIIAKINEAKKTGDFKKWAAITGKAIVNAFRFLITGVPKALLVILSIIQKINLTVASFKNLWIEVKISAVGFSIILQQIIKGMVDSYIKIRQITNVGGIYDKEIAFLQKFSNSQKQVVKQLNADRAKMVAEQGKNLADFEEDQKAIDGYRETLTELEAGAQQFITSLDKTVAAKKKDTKATNEQLEALKKYHDLMRKIAELKKFDTMINADGITNINGQLDDADNRQ